MKKLNKLIASLIFLSLSSYSFSQAYSPLEYRPFKIQSRPYISSTDFIDFNNDGLKDLIIAEKTGEGLRIRLKINEGITNESAFSLIDSTYEYETIFSSIRKSVFMSTSDIDLDGDADIIYSTIPEYDLFAETGIIINNSDSISEFLFEEVEIDLFERENYLAYPSLIDLNNDGLQDVIISNYDGNILVYKNEGNLRFTKSNLKLFDQEYFSSLASLVEIKKENELYKILGFSYETGIISFYKEGEYFKLDKDEEITSPDERLGKFFQLRSRDFNRDGIADIFINNLTFNDKKGYFTDHWLLFGKEMNFIIKKSKTECGDSRNGKLELKIFSGKPPFFYSWKSSNGQFGGGKIESSTPNASQTIGGLRAGIFEIFIEDSNGVNYSDTAVIESVNKLDILLDTLIIPKCSGNCDGLIKVETRGSMNDTLSNDYFWFNESGALISNDLASKENASIINGLCSGKYRLVVESTAGCVTEKIYNIPAREEINISSQINSACGDGFSSIVVNGENGEAPYKFLWNTNDTTNYIELLKAGKYSVSIVDKNGCSSSSDFFIPYIDPFTVNTEKIDISCFDNNDGQIIINAKGGVPPYNYEWYYDNGTKIESHEHFLNGLSKGNYTVHVFPASSPDWCKIEQNVLIKKPELLVASLSWEYDGAETGWKTTVNPKGGVLPYHIQWSNGIFGNEGFYNETGKYWVEITDKNGCFLRKEFEILITNAKNENLLNNFRTYPSPTNQFVNIEVDFNKKVRGSLVLKSAAGEALFKKDFHKISLNERLELSSYSSGIYLVILQFGKSILTDKIIYIK